MSDSNNIIITSRSLFFLLSLLIFVHGIDESVKELSSSSTTTTGTTTAAAAAVTTTTTRKLVTDGNWWQPKANDRLTWQWQISNSDNIDLSYNVNVYDIDLVDVQQSVIDTLKARGIKVICYFSAGTYESYRDDWSEYFTFIKKDQMYKGSAPPFGKVMSEWPNERWLDIRRIDLLRPIMTSRIQYAKQRGCDAVEPDNVDVYTNKKDSGFKNITAADQIQYNTWIATLAHQYNLSVGLKNDMNQLSSLVPVFDFAVNEQCFQYNECSGYTNTFIKANKSVFGVEYTSNGVCKFCKKARTMKLSWMKKKLNLNAWRIGCDDPSTIKLCKFSS